MTTTRRPRSDGFTQGFVLGLAVAWVALLFVLMLALLVVLLARQA